MSFKEISPTFSLADVHAHQLGRVKIVIFIKWTAQAFLNPKFVDKGCAFKITATKKDFRVFASKDGSRIITLERVLRMSMSAMKCDLIAQSIRRLFALTPLARLFAGESKIYADFN